jgi:hypothetical protein
MVTRECGAQVADLLPLLKSEIFIGVWFGKMVFLPGNPWYPVGWRLPEKDMKDLATHLRRVSFPLVLSSVSLCCQAFQSCLCGSSKGSTVIM